MLGRIVILLVSFLVAMPFAMAQSTSLSATMNVHVFPREGQDEVQQSMDEADCYSWAVDRTGTDPFDLSRQAAEQAAASEQAMAQARSAGQGATGRGAARGAVAGGVIGGVLAVVKIAVGKVQLLAQPQVPLLAIPEDVAHRRKRHRKLQINRPRPRPPTRHKWKISRLHSPPVLKQRIT